MAFKVYQINDHEIWAAETFADAVNAAKQHAYFGNHDQFYESEQGNIVPLDEKMIVEEEGFLVPVGDLIDERFGPHIVGIVND